MSHKTLRLFPKKKMLAFSIFTRKFGLRLLYPDSIALLEIL
jgi:hypothetical protein